MRILPYSDWKQRIAFDNIIYKEVKKYSLHLNTYERELMEYQIDFYRNHFSLLQVMENFKKLSSENKQDSFQAKANLNSGLRNRRVNLNSGLLYL